MIKPNRPQSETDRIQSRYGRAIENSLLLSITTISTAFSNIQVVSYNHTKRIESTSPETEVVSDHGLLANNSVSVAEYDPQSVIFSIIRLELTWNVVTHLLSERPVDLLSNFRR